MAIAKTAKLVATLQGPAGPGFLRGRLPNGTNVNTFRTPGIWIIPTLGAAQSMIGLPVAWPGVLFIKADSSVSEIIVTQEFSTYRAGNEIDKAGIWDRLSAGTDAYSSWSRRPIDHGAAIGAFDLDTLSDGKIAVYGSNASTLVNGPPNAAPGIVCTWTASSFTVMKAQLYMEYGTNGRILFRGTANISGGMSQWKDLTATGGGGDAPLFGAGTPSEMRIQAFKDDYPLVTTGNKGAVVFRYDHGLKNLKSGIVPVHAAAGLPYYIALNSRNWDLAENAGTTQADARSWIASGLAEFGNHCADHTDKTTAAAIHDTVVKGREELEEQLQTVIHGFTVPGVGGGGFGGFTDGKMNAYSSTYMGEVLLANHAICSGNIGLTNRRKLDGVVRQGGRHYTWESATFTQVKEQIDLAVSEKRALTLMAHPSRFGTAGYFNAALLQQVIDYVKSLINSGMLANISYYQSHHAKL